MKGAAMAKEVARDSFTNFLLLIGFMAILNLVGTRENHA
jgi:hypothetical protein